MKFKAIEILIDNLVLISNQLFKCIIAVFVCCILIKVSNYLVQKFFNTRIGSKKWMDPRKANTMKSIVSSVIRYLFYFITIFSVLTFIGIPVASLLAVAGVGSVAIGFGAQTLVKDVIEGFFILLEDQYGVGDIVNIEGRTGTVEDITIRTTRLRAADGTVYIIPNGSVGIVTNMCKEYINAVVDVNVDYSENAESVINILNDEMQKAEKAVSGLRAIPVVLGITSLDESSVTIRIVAECEIKENYRIERQLKLMIKNRLDKEKIIMPFPQRTIHLVQS